MWQIWCFAMFLSILLGTAISKFDTFSLYHIVRTQIAKVTNFFPFCTIGISMYQKRIIPYFIIPSTFSPQASSPLERSGQTNRQTNRQMDNIPCYPSFFFPLSARGPPHRRNSAGLAELWGGWPIEWGETLLWGCHDHWEERGPQLRRRKHHDYRGEGGLLVNLCL